MNTIIKLFGCVFIILVMARCNPLEKENLLAINTNDVWGTPELAEGYVNDMFSIFMPNDHIFLTPRYTDETMVHNAGVAAKLTDYLKGTLTEDTYNYYPYGDIRKINIFLDGIEQATFDVNIKNSLKGQVLFWRAWAYFRMVKAYGGVPLILESISPAADIETIFVPRSKTSDCIAQIVKDLDEAISLLENQSNIGRIDKCVAMAFKGRVLLYWASPQFNRDNDVSRWTDAYNANKSALDFLNSQGKGLYGDYNELWHDEMNREVIMVRRQHYPEYPNQNPQRCMRPLLWSAGCVGWNSPSLELVNAYPMKDGSKWDADAMDYVAFYQNRDERFYATVASNGSEPFISEMVGNTNMWTYYYDADGDPSTGINGKETRSDAAYGIYFPRSSFYPVKMLDRDISIHDGTLMDGQVDWIEIRYAEVLMNMAEAANETGKTDEALEVLCQIRERAGIEAGAAGKYGITATGVPEIRQVIMDERFVEFAFEDKRFWDLRRWRVYTSTFNNMTDKSFHGLRIEWDGTTENRPTGLTDINTIWDQFTVTVISDYEQTNVLDEDKYSFFGIPKSILERNSKLEQNNTWGGTFDPLL